MAGTAHCEPAARLSPYEFFCVAQYFLTGVELVLSSSEILS
jgi:hypothetical protein